MRSEHYLYGGFEVIFLDRRAAGFADSIRVHALNSVSAKSTHMDGNRVASYADP